MDFLNLPEFATVFFQFERYQTRRSCRIVHTFNKIHSNSRSFAKPITNDVFPCLHHRGILSQPVRFQHGLCPTGDCEDRQLRPRPSCYPSRAHSNHPWTYIDNDAATTITQSPHSHNKTKDVDIRHHSDRERVLEIKDIYTHRMDTRFMMLTFSVLTSETMGSSHPVLKLDEPPICQIFSGSSAMTGKKTGAEVEAEQKETDGSAYRQRGDH